MLVSVQFCFLGSITKAHEDPQWWAAWATISLASTLVRVWRWLNTVDNNQGRYENLTNRERGNWWLRNRTLPRQRKHNRTYTEQRTANGCWHSSHFSLVQSYNVGLIQLDIISASSGFRHCAKNRWWQILSTWQHSCVTGLETEFWRGEGFRPKLTTKHLKYAEQAGAR